jgi:hypothetical protein
MGAFKQVCVKISALGVLEKRNRGVPRSALLCSFAHFPTLRDVHEAPYYVAVLKNPPACDASRQRRLESEQPHLAVVLGGLACGVVCWRSGMLYAIKYTMLVSVHTYI